jgi:hypothetical protein
MARTIFGSGITDPGYRLIVIEYEPGGIRVDMYFCRVPSIVRNITIKYINKRFYVRSVFIFENISQLGNGIYDSSNYDTICIVLNCLTDSGTNAEYWFMRTGLYREFT